MMARLFILVFLLISSSSSYAYFGLGPCCSGYTCGMIPCDSCGSQALSTMSSNFSQKSQDIVKTITDASQAYVKVSQTLVKRQTEVFTSWNPISGVDATDTINAIMTAMGVEAHSAAMNNLGHARTWSAVASSLTETIKNDAMAQEAQKQHKDNNHIAYIYRSTQGEKAQRNVISTDWGEISSVLKEMDIASESTKEVMVEYFRNGQFGAPQDLLPEGVINDDEEENYDWEYTLKQRLFRWLEAVYPATGMESDEGDDAGWLTQMRHIKGLHLDQVSTMYMGDLIIDNTYPTELNTKRFGMLASMIRGGVGISQSDIDERNDEYIVDAQRYRAFAAIIGAAWADIASKRVALVDVSEGDKLSVYSTDSEVYNGSQSYKSHLIDRVSKPLENAMWFSNIALSNQGDLGRLDAMQKGMNGLLKNRLVELAKLETSLEAVMLGISNEGQRRELKAAEDSL